MLGPDLDNRFAHHPPRDDATRGAHEKVRALCRAVAEELNRLLPEGREKSLAITHLEEVCMWSNAAIARHGGPAPS
jgi:hypothetical protein